jgi:hypothetical protein
MSTTFLVDSILNEEKEDQMDSSGTISESDESDLERNSDLNNSLCDSPKSFHSMTHRNSPVSEDELIRGYTVIRDPTDNSENISEITCAKCGHTGPSFKPNNHDNFDEKCEKCGARKEFFTRSKDCIKDLPTKPVLKFSVSAILSDTKRDCVKVRNGNNTSVGCRI